MESVSGMQDISADTSYSVPPENKARVRRKMNLFGLNICQLQMF